MTLDLDDLERLARAATPGKRRQGSVETHSVFLEGEEFMGRERVLLRMNSYYPHEADAAFVAACSPDVVIGLIERTRSAEWSKSQARAAVEALIDVLDEYEAQWGGDYLAEKWDLKARAAKARENVRAALDGEARS